MSGQGCGESKADSAEDDGGGADSRGEAVCMEALRCDTCGEESVGLEPVGVESAEVEEIGFEVMNASVEGVMVEAVGVKAFDICIDAIFLCVGQSPLHLSKVHAFWNHSHCNSYNTR